MVLNKCLSKHTVNSKTILNKLDLWAQYWHITNQIQPKSITGFTVHWLWMQMTSNYHLSIMTLFSWASAKFTFSSEFKACPETVGALRWCNGGRAHGQASLVSITFWNDQIEILHTIRDKNIYIFGTGQKEGSYLQCVYLHYWPSAKFWHVKDSFIKTPIWK